MALGQWRPTWGPCYKEAQHWTRGQGCRIQGAGGQCCLEGRGVQGSYVEGWPRLQVILGGAEPPTTQAEASLPSP